MADCMHGDRCTTGRQATSRIYLNGRPTEVVMCGPDARNAVVEYMEQGQGPAVSIVSMEHDDLYASGTSV